MLTQKNDAHPLREYNIHSILNALMSMKTVTRRQLAQRTGLSQPTVNSIVQELEKKGFVQPGSFAASAGGRRPQCYTLYTDHLRAATIKVLSKSLEYVVITIDGTVILRNAWAISGTDTPVTAIKALLGTLLKQDENIRVVGIGVPGVVGPGGVLGAIPQIPELEGVSLHNKLKRFFKIPIYIENDMNLVALGSVTTEPCHTAATDMVFVHVGEGVGAGIVMSGQIIRGFSSFAGEIAHMLKPIEADETPPEAGNVETLEYLLKKTNNITEQAKLISTMIISIICLINPPVISFGSTYASEEMLRLIRHECEKHLPVWTLPSFQLTVDEEATYERGLSALVGDILKNRITHELTTLQK
ncbi:MAG: ROK family transcriptional regulator [Oscillospiraceae bacterium]|nr:ROK family transcriptional regulator [Oscillospiraceae bacterium]